jgi:hypothetical protein
MSPIENWFAQQEEPNKSCYLALRQIILRFDPDISEAWKYRLPFYLYKGKSFCYLWEDKKTHEPYIGIHNGYLIEHSSLVAGDRTRIKVFPISPLEDIPVEALYEVFAEAKALRNQ